MSTKVRELKARKATLTQQARALTTVAEKAGRDMSADEQTQFDALMTQVRDIDAQITREEQLLAAEAGLDANGGVNLPANAHITVSDNRANDPTHGFASLGEFAQTVRRGSRPGASVDERLLIGAAAPGTVGNEGSGEDGGFPIPPQFSNEIWRLSLGEDSLIPLTDNTEITGNSMVFPQDETTPWGTDGVRAYWQNEGTAGTPTKPKLGVASLRLNKLMALVPLTTELEQDQRALGSYLPEKVADSIRWKANEAIMYGSGAGQPLGANNSGARIVVAKESGQSAGTVVAANLAKMVSRLPPGSYARAVWQINNDVLPALFTMTLGNYPIYLPFGGGQGAVASSPYGLLLGRPVVPTQHAPSVGAEGDIQLMDFKYYRSITKAGGIQTATSIHLYFDADATAFRATFRMDGASKLKAAITPAKGSNTLSPFVALGART